MSAPSWPPGYGLHRLRQVDSTNAEAVRISPGLSSPVWIMADRQTKARGRRGRAWSTPKGALATTLLMFPSEPPATAALRSFVIALALADAFEQVGVEPEAISLKWPNDVLLHGYKSAGILLECAGRGDVLEHLAIGVGINLTGQPNTDIIEAGATAPITVAEVLGRPVAPDDMLTALAAAYANWETHFLTEGFGPIREAWLARAARLGEVITARTTAESHTGTFETIDPEGNLRLRTARGPMAIAAADVYFGP